MIERTNRSHVFQYLEDNSDLNVVDLGCGTSGSCPFANVFVDVHDHSEHFVDHKFVKHDLNTYPLPFKDKEFDYSFTSHILEHISDPLSFLKEVVRISKAGYVEVPSPIIDNLVSGDDQFDPYGHKWWLYYDDPNEKIIIRPRRHILRKSIGIPELNLLYPFFRSSFVLELQWKNSINVDMGDEKYSYENKEYDLSQITLKPWVLGFAQ